MRFWNLVEILIEIESQYQLKIDAFPNLAPKTNTKQGINYFLFSCMFADSFVTLRIGTIY